MPTLRDLKSHLTGRIGKHAQSHQIPPGEAALICGCSDMLGVTSVVSDLQSGRPPDSTERFLTA